MKFPSSGQYPVNLANLFPSPSANSFSFQLFSFSLLLFPLIPSITHFLRSSRWLHCTIIIISLVCQFFFFFNQCSICLSSLPSNPSYIHFFRSASLPPSLSFLPLKCWPNEIVAVLELDCEIVSVRPQMQRRIHRLIERVRDGNGRCAKQLPDSRQIRPALVVADRLPDFPIFRLPPLGLFAQSKYAIYVQISSFYTRSMQK